jgi:hypothetical protein
MNPLTDRSGNVFRGGGFGRNPSVSDICREFVLPCLELPRCSRELSFGGRIA